MTGEHPGRTPMALVHGYAVVWVPDEDVAEKQVQGWVKYSRKSAPTTGLVPTQRQSGN